MHSALTLHSHHGQANNGSLASVCSLCDHVDVIMLVGAGQPNVEKVFQQQPFVLKQPASPSSHNTTFHALAPLTLRCVSCCT